MVKIEIITNEKLYQELNTANTWKKEQRGDGSITLTVPLTEKNKLAKITFSENELLELAKLAPGERALRIQSIVKSVEEKAAEQPQETRSDVAVKLRRPKTAVEEKFLAQIERSPLTGNGLIIGHSWGNGVTEYGKLKMMRETFAKRGVDVSLDSACVDGAHFGEVAFATDRIIDKRAKMRAVNTSAI